MVVKVLGLSAGGLIGAGVAAYLLSRMKLNIDPTISSKRSDLPTYESQYYPNSPMTQPDYQPYSPPIPRNIVSMPSINYTAPEQNPIRTVSLNISLDDVDPETRDLIATTLLRRESFDFRWNLAGWNPWKATNFKNNLAASSVGFNIIGLGNPESETNVLQLWAMQGPGGANAKYDWNTAIAQDVDGHILRGFIDGTPGYGIKRASVVFDFPDGSILRIVLQHTSTELTDQFSGSGKMSVRHFYRVYSESKNLAPGLNNGIFLHVPMQQASSNSTSTFGNIIL